MPTFPRQLTVWRIWALALVVSICLTVYHCNMDLIAWDNAGIYSNDIGGYWEWYGYSYNPTLYWSKVHDYYHTMYREVADIPVLILLIGLVGAMLHSAERRDKERGT
jgi:hypothetical protein